MAGDGMLGQLLLGGSILGGGGSGSASGRAGVSGTLGAFFLGSDLLGAAEPVGAGGGGGGAVAGTGFSARINGGSEVTGSVEITKNLPLEGLAAGDSSPEAFLNSDLDLRFSVIAGEAASTSSLLRLDAQGFPWAEDFQTPAIDFPQGEGESWNLDNWFVVESGSVTSSVNRRTVIEDGRGLIEVTRSGGSQVPLAVTTRADNPFGDFDLSFSFEVESEGVGTHYPYIGFRTDGLWNGARPLNGYSVLLTGESSTLMRSIEGSNTSIATWNHGLIEGEHLFRIYMIGGRIRLKVWAVADPEPAEWSLDFVDPTPVPSGYLSFRLSHTGASFSGTSRIYLDDILIERIPVFLEAAVTGETSFLSAQLTYPQPLDSEFTTESQVVASLDAHSLPGGEINGVADVQAQIYLESELGGEVDSASEVTADIETFAYGGLSEGSSELAGTPTVAYDDVRLDEFAGDSNVTADVTFWVEISLNPFDCSSEVAAALDVYMLSGALIPCESDVAAHLWYLDGIVPLSAGAAGSAATTGAVIGFFSASVDVIQGMTSFANALLTYWKPMAPEVVVGSSSVEGDYDIYTIPPDPIECSSEIYARLDGDWNYTGIAEGFSDLFLTMEVDTYFLPGVSNGSASVIEFGFTLRPHDLQVGQIEGSSSFKSVGSGFLVLNLNRDLAGEVTTPLTSNDDDHPYTGTRFIQAILGMPVVIGLYQADRANGLAEVVANLFVNEGGQANCNSRVEGLLTELREVALAGTTNDPPSGAARFVTFLLSDLPDYYRPEPPQVVLDAIGATMTGTPGAANRGIRVSKGECGSGFLWVDFWRHGDLEPQVSAGSSGLGTYYEDGKNTHPLTSPNNDSHISGVRSGWNRAPGWFVDSHYYSFNYMGLYASTSTEEDQYTMPLSWPSDHPLYRSGPNNSNTTPYGSAITSNINSGIMYHEPLYDDHEMFFHGICGARFVSTLDGSNSIDMDLELKSSMWGLIAGIGEVVGDFIVLRFRTMTVQGNLARKADRVAYIEGSTSKSPNARIPHARQRGDSARELEKVRSGNTLYT